MTFDAAGRLERTTTSNTGAYVRHVYGPDYLQTYATVNNVADEAYAIQIYDGFGRVIASASNHPVRFEVETSGSPSAGSALGRLILSLPALAVWIVLSFASGVLWFAAALCVLASERVPAALSDFIEATLRYQFRLFAYHLSLVDRYPSFETLGASHSSPDIAPTR